MTEVKTVLVTGYAKAPQGTSMYEIYKHAGIVLEIDPSTHTILDAEVTVITDLTQNFFKKLLRGYCLADGIDNIVSIIRSHYFAPSQQAIIVAFQAAVQRYWDNLKE